MSDMSLVMSLKALKELKKFFDFGAIKFDIKQGYIIQPDGLEYVNAPYWVSSFIPVKELYYYSVNFKTGVIYYDANKVRFSSGNVDRASFLMPENTAYIKFSGLLTDLLNPTSNMVLTEGTIVKNLGDLKPKRSNIELEVIQGKIIQPDGNVYDSAGYYATNFIRVTPSINYAINFKTGVKFYDKNRAYLTTLTVDKTTFHNPINSYFIRMSSALTDLLNPTSNMVLVEGDIVKILDDCPPVIKSNYIQRIQEKYWVTGKNVTFYGDSQTQQGFFQKHLHKKVNFGKTYKQGIGGTSVANNGKYSNVSADGINVHALDVPVDFVPSSGIVIPSNFCMQERINLIPLDTEVIICMAATNDFGQDVPLGDFSYPYNDTTLSGSMILMIQRMKTRVPKAEIFITSPVFGASEDGLNMEQLMINGLGLTILDYTTVVKKACEIMSVHYVPVGETCGISFYNLDENLEDGVHLNDTGALKVATSIFKSIKDYKPINI